MNALDNYILKILYDEDKLNYLFQKNVPLTEEDRIRQLRRFVETSFINREDNVKDSEIYACIKNNEEVKSYYSFFAEALLARLNIDYIDKDLITGVIAVNENLTKVSTGADVCMFSESNLVLGEAKFYGNLYSGITNIIKDKSFKSKLEDYIKNLMNTNSEIVLKGLNGDVSKKTSEQIKLLPLILSGFVLHTKNSNDKYESSYKTINKINITNFPTNYNIHLYHLPIQSKNEMIFKAQRKALDLIVSLKHKI